MVRYYNNCAIPRTGRQSECKFSQNGAQFEVPEEFTQNIPKKTLPPPEINVAHMLEFDRMIILFEFLEVLIGNINDNTMAGVLSGYTTDRIQDIFIYLASYSFYLSRQV